MISIKQYCQKRCPSALQRSVYVVVKIIKTIYYRAYAYLFPNRMQLYCPCCGLKLKSFVKSDYYWIHPDQIDASRYTKTKQDVLCPLCRSLPRHRILALWCEEHKEQLRNSKILYFAVEPSMKIWMQRNAISYTSADLYSKADIKLDIQHTGLADDSYNLVIANHVLEHVDDFRKALNEVYRILRPNGYFICSFPMDPRIELLVEENGDLTPAERVHRFGQYNHKRLFGIQADRLLTEENFIVQIIEGNDCPKEIAPLVGPADYDINRLFCCRKA